MSNPAWLVLTIPALFLFLYIPRKGNGDGKFQWLDLPIPILATWTGWLVAATPGVGWLVSWTVKWMGPFGPLMVLGGFGILFLTRGESVGGKTTWSDRSMAILCLFGALALYHLPTDPRNPAESPTVGVALEKQAKEAEKERAKMVAEAEAKAKAEVSKPIPKLSKAEKDSIEWDGARVVKFPVRGDGEWICNGSIVRNGALVIGSHEVYVAGGKLVYKASTALAAPPQVQFKPNSGDTTEPTPIPK